MEIQKVIVVMVTPKVLLYLSQSQLTTLIIINVLEPPKKKNKERYWGGRWKLNRSKFAKLGTTKKKEVNIKNAAKKPVK